MGQFRLDVDVGFIYHFGRFSVGVVIRHHQDRICAASAYGIRHPGSVLATKSLTIRYGLSLAFQSDYSNFWVFSDSDTTVQKVNSSSKLLNFEGALIDDVS